MELSSYSGCARADGRRRNLSAGCYSRDPHASFSSAPSELTQRAPEQMYCTRPTPPLQSGCLLALRKSAAARLKSPIQARGAPTDVRASGQDLPRVFSRQRVLGGSARSLRSSPSSPTSQKIDATGSSPREHPGNASLVNSPAGHEGSCRTSEGAADSSPKQYNRASSYNPTMSPLKATPSKLTLLRPTLLGVSTADVVRAHSMRSMGGIAMLAHSPLSPTRSPNALCTDEASRNIFPELTYDGNSGGHPFGSVYSSCAGSPVEGGLDRSFPLRSPGEAVPEASHSPRVDSSSAGHARQAQCSRSGSIVVHAGRQMTPFGSERSFGSSIKEEVEDELRELTTMIANIVLRSRRRARAQIRKEEKEAQLKRLEDRLYGVVEAREREEALRNSQASVLKKETRSSETVVNSVNWHREGSEIASDPPPPTGASVTAPPSSSLTFSPPPFSVPLNVSLGMPQSPEPSLSPRRSPRASPRGLCATEEEARGASDILLESHCVVVPLWPEREYCRVIVKGLNPK